MDRETYKTGINELAWVLSDDLQEAVNNLLFQKEENNRFISERGFLGIVFSGQGLKRRSLFLKEIIPQERGWVTETEDGLSFSPKYFSRALDRLTELPSGAGLIIVHSHPLGLSDSIPHPSKPDIKHEKRLLYHLSKTLSKGSPTVAGIVSRSGSWRVREYFWTDEKSSEELSKPTIGIESYSYLDIKYIRIYSKDSIKIRNYDQYDTPLKNVKEVDSTIRLWGKDGQKILSQLRVGIVGLGGVGSILTEFLARLGVGELILVDFDLVTVENMNRQVGAQKEDIGKPKVDYAIRMAKKSATSSQFQAYGYLESASEQDGLNPILDTDIIMNAADNAFIRQVLDHVSFSYAISVIDGGTVIIVDQNTGETVGKSQVAETGPGKACLECIGNYDQEKATLARETPFMQGPNRYLQVAGEISEEKTIREPSIISHNGLVASLMVQRLLSRILDFPPKNKVGQQRFYIEQGELFWNQKEVCNTECEKSSWTCLGDSHYIPVGVDPYWDEMRNKLNKS